MKYPDNLELIAADNRGVYIPQHVAEACTLEPMPVSYQTSEESKATLAECIAILKAGPEHEEYWDSWAHVLDYACIRVGRRRWGLYQDGDCWAYALNRAGRRELSKLVGSD